MRRRASCNRMLRIHREGETPHHTIFHRVDLVIFLAIHRIARPGRPHRRRQRLPPAIKVAVGTGQPVADIIPGIGRGVHEDVAAAFDRITKLALGDFRICRGLEIDALGIRRIGDTAANPGRNPARLVLDPARRCLDRKGRAIGGMGGDLIAVKVVALGNTPADACPAITDRQHFDDEGILRVERPASAAPEGKGLRMCREPEHEKRQKQRSARRKGRIVFHGR